MRDKYHFRSIVILILLIGTSVQQRVIAQNTPPTSCGVTLEMYDQYGDGWNNAVLSIYQHDTLVASVTMNGGRHQTQEIQLTADSVYLSWQSGWYDSECTFYFINEGGDTLYVSPSEDMGGMSGISGSFASFMNVCSTCSRPNNLRLVSRTATQLVVAWDGEAGASYQVQHAPYGSSIWTTSISTSNTMTINGLSAGQAETVRVRRMCGNETSGYRTSTFMTPCSTGNCTYVVRFFDRSGMSGETGTSFGGNHIIVMHNSGAVIDTIHVPYPLTINEDEYMHYYDYNLQTCVDSLTFGYYSDSSYTPWGLGIMVFNADYEEILYAPVQELEGNNGSNYVIPYYCPTCLAVQNLESRAIDSVRARVTWRSNGGSQFLVKYRASNDYNAPFSTLVTSDTTVILNNLTQNTYYEVSVSALCGAGDTSAERYTSFQSGLHRTERIYVKQGANGNYDGTSWNNAYGYVSQAVEDAHRQHEIYGHHPEVWVAQGTYTPINTWNSLTSLPSDVYLYGGFVGNETSFSQRPQPGTPEFQHSILDCQNNNSNVVYQDGYYTDEHQSIIDGFIIQNGYTGADLRSGATIRNCIIRNNKRGLVLYGDQSLGRVHVDHCQVINNSDQWNDAGIRANHAVIDNTLIAGNSTENGGSSGLYLLNNVTVRHCDIVGNIVNNTTSTNNIHGVFVNGFNDTLINCIVWGNVNSSNSTLSQISPSDQLISLHSASTDTLNGTGNILLSAVNLGGEPGVNYVSFIAPETGDYRLNLGSACIDAGMTISGYSTTDLAGNARVYGDGVDMGCYENDGTFVCSIPMGLNVTDITENSAILHWSSSLTDEYTIQWAEGDSDDWTTVTGLTTNQYSLTGLYKYTTYKFKVTTICNGAETEYSDVFRFKTICPDPIEGFTIQAPEGTTVTSTSSVPIYTSYRHSGSYLMIRENELGGIPRLIDTIGFQFLSTARDRDLVISMGTINQNYFNWNDTSNIINQQTVFRGVAHFTPSTDDNPWSYIAFDRGFQYDGSGSIVIKIVDTSETASSWGSFRAYYLYGLYSHYFYGDDYSYHSSSYYRPYMYFSGGCDMAPCPKPIIALDSVSDHDATFTCSRLEGTPQMEYKLQSETEYTLATDVSFTDSSCQLSGLRHNSAYDVRLRRICPWGDTSEWVTLQLSTIPYHYVHIYVKADAIGNNDGTTWSNAYSNLNDALASAVATSQYYGETPDVWVAAGVYFGDTSNGTAQAFRIQQGVNVYGGFVGNESSIDARPQNEVASLSILDGQNVQNVLRQSYHFDEGTETVWDGFVIRNGYDSYSGGGAYIMRGTTLRNILFTNCSIESSWGEGAALYMYYGVAENCTFTNSGRAATSMNVIRSQHSKLINCKATGITTCIVLSSDYDTIRRCEFSDNHLIGNIVSVNYGYVENSLFSNNSSNNTLFNFGHSTFVNCDIVGNSSRNSSNTFDGWNITFKNSILWGNTPKTINSSRIDSMLYCAVEGGYEGEGNINLESENVGNNETLHYPAFVSPEDSDYRLAGFSACVDAGGAIAEIGDGDSDIAGNARVYGEGVDMGCYEYRGESFCLKPVGVAVERASTAAVVSWVTPEGVPGVDVEYRVANQNDPSTGSGQENSWTVIPDISGDHFMIEGLTTGLTYEVRLRSHCGSDYYSGYTAPVSFVTGCTQYGNTLVGDSTMQSSIYYLPIYSYFPYSYTQQIFLASELTLDNEITAIQFQQRGANASRHLKVYLGHTSQSSFSSGSDAVAASALTEVFDGNVAMTSEESWITIPLTTPFTYNNSDNLVLAVIDTTASYGASSYFGIHTTSDYKMLYLADYTPYDVDSSYDFSYYYYRNNVRFVTACVESTCPVPLLTVQDVNYNSAKVVCQTGLGQRVQMQWKRSGDESYTVLTTTQEQTLSGLRQNSTYHVRARTICLGDTSNWNIVTFTTPANEQSVYYVSTTGNANANATSWQDATSDLNWAMASAKAAHDQLGVRAQVWVAQGTYYGNTNDVNAFNVLPYVDVYGGFAGNESSIDARPQNAVTTLDGQNQRRVIYQASALPNGDSVIWDGFTITGGTTAAVSSYEYGGGAYLQNGFILQNSTVKNNTANYGGGLYLYYTTLRNCVIVDNSANSYGGLYGNYSNITNCLIANNSASGEGGAYLYQCDLLNSTIVANHSTNDNTANYLSYSHAYNCVFWGNKTRTNSEDSYQTSNGYYYNCAFQDDWPQSPLEISNCILLDNHNSGRFNSPAFVQPSNEAGMGHGDGSNWALLQGSILIDKGGVVPTEIGRNVGNKDLAGNSRVQGNGIDIGCYESNYTGSALPEYVDGRVYVVEGGAGTQNGTSWSNAMADINGAIMMAASKGGLDVWVAQGRYYGNTEADNAFKMIEGVNVYGGFAGTETSIDARPQNAVATLDGLNIRRVLMQYKHFDTLTVWDGFTLQNGFVTDGKGAAAILRGGSQLRNCEIQYNILFSTGSYSYTGGAIAVNGNYYTYNNDTSLWGCVFHNNYSQHQNEGSHGYANGTALYATYTNIVNCLFHDNNGYQGTVYLTSNARMYNCVVSNNQAYQYAGVYLSSSTHIYSSVIAQNVSQYSTGGLYSNSSYNTVNNSIIWGNKQNYVASNINNYLNVNNCAIEGGFEGGTNVINIAASNDGNNSTLNYVRFIDPTQNNFRLHPASHCLDQGDTALGYLPYDMDGNARINGLAIDLGAYESSESSSCPSPLNLRCTSVSGTSATFAWSPVGSESQWQFTIVGTSNSLDSTITVSDTVLTVGNLGLNQTYTAHVRANCGGEYSIHSPQVTITTLCDSTGLAPLSAFTALYPADSAIVMNYSADFSWNAIPEATSYDLYIWQDDHTEPTTPTVTGITLAGINNCTIPNWQRGKFYHWKVVAWNQCIKRSSQVQTFEANPLPDLHVTDVTFSQPMAGQPLTVTYTVKNDGRGATPAGASWNENIWIVSDVDVRYYDSHDNQGKIPGYENLQSLGPGESYTRSVTCVIPQQLVGNYYLFVFADQSDAYSINFDETGGIAPDPYTPSVTGSPYHYLKGSTHLHGDIDEVEDGDNFFYKSFYILPPPAPDLRVTHIGHPTQAFSNSTITVNWTVTNMGDAAAGGRVVWYDDVYIQMGDELNMAEALKLASVKHWAGMDSCYQVCLPCSSNGPCNPCHIECWPRGSALQMDSSYSVSANVHIPISYAGNYNIFVVTDAHDTVYESINEHNNEAISEQYINIIMTPLSDLQVSNVSMPLNVSPRQLVKASFTVTNIGAGATELNKWTDRLYLSPTPTLNGTAIQVAEHQHSGVLDIDESYTDTISFYIPKDKSGNYYLIVRTDANNQIFEGENEQNNRATSASPTLIQLPDLVVTQVIVPETQNLGEDVTVSAWIKNVGSGTAYFNNPLKTAFFHSNVVAVANSYGQIYPGDSIMVSSTVKQGCPNSAMAQVRVHTNYYGTSNDTILESNGLGGNIKTATYSVILPDLVAQSIVVAEDTAWSSNTVSLTMSVANTGTATLDDTINYNVYISNSPTTYTATDANIILSRREILRLTPNSSMPLVAFATLPNGIEGDYYLHFVVDENGRVCDGDRSNNEAHSGVFHVNLTPWPDLVVTHIEVPDSLMVGAAAQFNITIANHGIAPATGPMTTRVFMSILPTYGGNSMKQVASYQSGIDLPINDETNITVSGWVPTTVSAGHYYIYAVVDYNDNIYEHTGEDNNVTRSLDQSFFQIYPLDLVVDTIIGPDTLNWGETARYIVRMRNNSNVITSMPQWQDRLYFNADGDVSSNVFQGITHRGGLGAGESYADTFYVSMPYGASGEMILSAICDYNRDNPDLVPINNQKSKSVGVKSVPTPDLEISDVEILDSIISGQPFHIAYMVTNVSSTLIDSLTWNDKFTLSDVDGYTSWSRQLQQRRQVRYLDSGWYYRDTVTVTIPVPNQGSRFLLIHANAQNSFYESEQDNNVVVVPVNITLPPPGDLTVSNIERRMENGEWRTANDTITSGVNTTVRWSVKNIGNNTISGSRLSSLVYLSRDNIFSSNDKLLSTVNSGSITLAPGDSLVQQATISISGEGEGNRYFIVKTDVRNAFYEDDENNNTVAATAPTFVKLPVLPFNTPVTVTLRMAQALNYKLDVDTNINQTVRVYIEDGDSLAGAVNNIYVMHNNIGSSLNNDYSTADQYSANPELFIPSTRNGYYGITLEGSKPNRLPQVVKIRADILPFELRSINPSYGGNDGKVTVELNGSRFRPDMEVWMENGGDTLRPEYVIFESFYKAYARFDLNGVDTGDYNIGIYNYCEGESSLDSAFHVLPPTPDGLAHNLIFPNSPRPNRTIAMVLEFGNVGNTDIENAVLEIESVAGSYISLTTEGLQNRGTIVTIPLNIPGEPEGLLRPGIRGTVTIYAYTAGSLVFVTRRLDE